MCPFGAAGVGGAWMLRSMLHLLDGPQRYSDLRRRMPHASRQMLVPQLRRLERLGVVRRTVSADVPPKVEYELTASGRGEEEVLRELEGWGVALESRLGRPVDWPVLLGRRWTAWVLTALLDGPQRFGELGRRLPGMSAQSLSRELRGLRAVGLVERRSAADGDRHGRHGLTEAAHGTERMLRRVRDSGARWCERAGIEFEWPMRG